jgi:arylsulfatase A-like enzyme
MVDARIGQVLTALGSAGLENNTLVVFSTDHGDCQGAHGWNQKTILFEEAARVPCILSWKGFTRPSVSERLVNTGIDFLPTLCDYAGIPRPGGLPGISLKRPDDTRQFVVVSNHMVQGAEINGRKPEPQGRMLRSRRYKYTVYSEGERRESLVDLEEDPGEMRNLAGKPGSAQVLKEHRAMLAEWCRKYGDRFPLVTG